MKDFNSDAHVEEWMAENGGVEALRRGLARGLFGGQNKTLAAAWLQLHDKRESDRDSAANQALLERSVTAAETAAGAAAKSARWAMWAVVIALLAVVVAIADKYVGG